MNGSTDICMGAPASRQKRLAIATVSLLAVVSTGALSGCGPSDTNSESSGVTALPEPSTTLPKATTTTAASPSTTTTTVLTRAFDRGSYELLATDPDRFVGSTVSIVGKVFGTIERDGDAVYFQMFADPANSDWNTVVSYDDPTLAIATDDYVLVQGEVGGTFEGTNAYGGEMDAVAVFATSVAKTDATAAASTPLFEATPNGAIDQHGLVVQLDKVQYASEETRVFLTVTNNSGESASFYDFEAKATRGNEQFDAGYSYNDYPEVQSDILPGIATSGVVVFPPMNPAAPTRYLFEARTDNYTIDFEPYTFDVPAA